MEVVDERVGQPRGAVQGGVDPVCELLLLTALMLGTAFVGDGRRRTSLRVERAGGQERADAEDGAKSDRDTCVTVAARRHEQLVRRHAALEPALGAELQVRE
ncbi:MAG: hypothetical protein H0T20_07030 [Actinobacteria bacterium]|nr:hypothetical protein [Actinomycetota bacterium]